MKRNVCTVCHKNSLTTTIDLGLHPLADTFWPRETIPDEYVLLPLRVLRCDNCHHLFNEYEVSPKLRYQGVPYSYTTGNSIIAINHFYDFASQVMNIVPSKPKNVIDIGGNDGTLLSGFKKVGVENVLNIDPSENISQISRNSDIPTLTDFFNSKIVFKNNLTADLIVTANVLNHVDNLNEFMKGVTNALVTKGSFVFQVPYAPSLLLEGFFETIYHEHVNYFSASSISCLLKLHGFSVYDVHHTDYMCESIRVYCKKSDEDHCEKFKNIINKEIHLGFNSSSIDENFRRKVIELRNKLRKTIATLRLEGKKIIGLSAATKSNTLLNFCGIDVNDICHVADVSEHKIGKLMPGSQIPIINEKDIDFNNYDVAIILAENLVPLLRERLEHKIEMVSIR